MAWVVDTCVVLDVLEGDPEFGVRSAKLLKRLLPEGLLVCPVTFVELAPAFGGDVLEEKQFFDLAGLGYVEPMTLVDSEAAHAAWNALVRAKRRHLAGKRPVADVLIGGFAMRFQGIVTRNADDFRQWFPSLKIVVP
jgi:predicted nucleic acid-binding protein